MSNLSIVLLSIIIVATLTAMMGKNPLIPLILLLRFIAALCLTLASTLQAASQFMPKEFMENFQETEKVVQRVEA